MLPKSLKITPLVPQVGWAWLGRCERTEPLLYHIYVRTPHRQAMFGEWLYKTNDPWGAPQTYFSRPSGLWRLGFKVLSLGYVAWNLDSGLWGAESGVWRLEYEVWESRSVIVRYVFISFLVRSVILRRVFTSLSFRGVIPRRVFNCLLLRIVMLRPSLHNSQYYRDTQSLITAL